MAFTTHVEQVLACLLFAFLVGDTIVRTDMVLTSLRNRAPIHSYFKGWLSEKIFKDWYMFVRWERVVLALLASIVLTMTGQRLVMFVLFIKVSLDFLFHLILRFYSDRFFR